MRRFYPISDTEWDWICDEHGSHRCDCPKEDDTAHAGLCACGQPAEFEHHFTTPYMKSTYPAGQMMCAEHHRHYGPDGIVCTVVLRIIDNRASARAEARRQSLYNNDPDVDYERNRDHSVRTAPTRWAPGQDPHDDDAQPDSGWSYNKLEVTENESDADQYRDLSGPDSSVTCFKCRLRNYRIVQERTRDEIIKSQPELEWAQKMNRPVSTVDAPTVLLLFCPGCKHMVQLRESVVEQLRGKKVSHH